MWLIQQLIIRPWSYGNPKKQKQVKKKKICDKLVADLYLPFIIWNLKNCPKKTPREFTGHKPQTLWKSKCSGAWRGKVVLNVNNYDEEKPEAIAQRCSLKMLFLKISLDSFENTCPWVFFWYMVKGKKIPVN